MKKICQNLVIFILSALHSTYLIPASLILPRTSSLARYPEDTSEVSMSPLEACDILQELSEESSSDDESPKSLDTIDKLKAQKLLYYAQGYYIAILGKKIFNEPIEAWDYGPAIRVLHENWKDVRGTTLPKNIFKMARKSLNDKSANHTEIKAFLRTVYTMFSNFSGTDLIDKTHDEYPWKVAYERYKQRGESTIKSNENICHDDLAEFFRQPVNLSSFLASYIRVHSSEPKKIRAIIHHVRAIISEHYTDISKINELYRSFLTQENRDIIDTIYGACNDDLAWSNTDVIDCVIGYIFLPRQCEQLYEHFPVYLHFEHIRRLFTLSARHGHPLAHLYMNRILASYKLADENADDDESSSSHRHLNKTAQNLLSSHVNQQVRPETIPALHAGLLHLTLGNSAVCTEFFERGYKNGNPLCAYFYAVRKRQVDLLSDLKFIALLESSSKGLVFFLKAELANTQNERYMNYRKAGELGIAEGYFLAALIRDQLEDAINEPNAVDLYLLAARKGALGGYEKALDALIKQDKFQDASKIAAELEKLGSTYGFVILGKALNGEEAKKALKKASLIESYPFLRPFVDEESAYELTYRNKLDSEYTKLKIDANYEEPPAEDL
jgi:uncharacterized phage-associated protein